MNTPRKMVLATSVLGAMAAGGLFGATVLAPSISSAATVSTTAPSSTQTPPDHGAPGDPAKGGHIANGITEKLLTGETASKVEAAATAAVPGGTIERVENDAEGSAYEAHVAKADGSHVTVKVDAGFKVTTVEDGPR